MLELLSPAGSPEAVTAAVQGGADAIYLGYGDFNARRNAKNFSLDELKEAVAYCHIRGVKVYLTLNTLVTDRELELAAKTAQEAASAGVDAVLIQDLGVLSMLRQAAPSLEIHGSTQLTVHSLEGVLRCAELGITRVVLSRELSRDAIEHICKNSPIEIEIFVHGALCMCYSGQCYMSSVIGGRSGNRGLCAQPCRLNYGFEGKADSYPLSLKDMSLASHLQELEDIGVKCIKIEGRMKRAEYVAIVTDIYSRAIRENRQPSRDEIIQLEKAFSRQGFTQGYFENKLGKEMFGIREDTKEPKELFSKAKGHFLSGKEVREKQPISFLIDIKEHSPALLTAFDRDGNTVKAYGTTPEKARTKALSEDAVESQLSRTGDTPFAAENIKISLQPNLSLPLSAINAMRREALEELKNKRASLPKITLGEFVPQKIVKNQNSDFEISVSLSSFEQMSDELLSLSPSMIYLPVDEAADNLPAIEKYMNKGGKFALRLPRISWDDEREKLTENLRILKESGINDALIGTLDLIEPCKSMGFGLISDYGIGIYNSQTVHMLKALGFETITPSFELSLPQIRDLTKELCTELIIYGRLPLMITENCIKKNHFGKCVKLRDHSLTDRKGNDFPIVCAPGCRNEILNSKTLYLADKPDYLGLGIHRGRLLFTIEDANECINITKSCLNTNNYLPQNHTRGLYYRSVR